MLTDEQKKEMLLELSGLCEEQGDTYKIAFFLINVCIDKLSEMNGKLVKESDARYDTSAALKQKANGASNAALAEVGMNMYHLDKALELFTKYIENCKAQLESAKALDDKEKKKMGDLLDELTNP